MSFVMSFAALFFLSRFGVFLLQAFLVRVVPLRKDAKDAASDAASEASDASKPASGAEKSTAPSLGAKDYLFIGINQFVETAFIQQVWIIAKEVSFSDSFLLSVLYFPFSYLAYAIYNMGVALLLLFADDFLYEHFHALLHKDRFLYDLVHRHHHRATRPTRGYIDAINETPLEMGGALVLNLFAIRILRPILTLPSLALFLSMKATFAIVNHLDRGFEVSFYSSERHALHHARKTCHYGQL